MRSYSSRHPRRLSVLLLLVCGKSLKKTHKDINSPLITFRGVKKRKVSILNDMKINLI